MPENEVAQPKFSILGHGVHRDLGVELVDRQDAPASAEPAIIQEIKEEPIQETPIAEPAKNEVTLGKSEAPQGEPQAKAEPTPTLPKSWEDSLKEQGLDEKFIKVAKLYKETGNLKPYMEALTVDVAKMSPEQVLRYDLQKKYPTANQEDLELLYETEVKDKYKLDEEKYLPETVEAKAGKAKMRMDVEALRTKISEDLSKFEVPSFDRQAEVQRQQEEFQAQQQANIDSFLNDDYVKATVKDKKIVIGNLGQGVPDLNMILEDPSEITGILTNPELGKKYITDKEGKLDRRKQMLISTFASNIDGYNQVLINYGKSLGKEELIETASNPPKQVGSPASPSKESLKEAFVNRGIAGRGR